MLPLRASLSIWRPVKGDAMAQNGGLRPSPYSVFLHESCRYPKIGEPEPSVDRAAFAVGIVLSMQTRASLERFGAEALIPAAPSPVRASTPAPFPRACSKSAVSLPTSVSKAS